MTDTAVKKQRLLNIAIWKKEKSNRVMKRKKTKELIKNGEVTKQ